VKPARASIDDESGISLVELLVYSMLIGLVLVIVGGMLISSLSTEKTVRSVVQATTAGQLASRSIDAGVRNALQLQLSSPAGSDQLIRARVQDAKAPDTTYCAAWYYSDADGTIRYKAFTPSSPAATAVIPATFTPAELASWLLLVDGVSPAAGRPASDPIFALVGTALSVDFAVSAGDDPPPAISTSSTRRLTLENSQCY